MQCSNLYDCAVRVSPVALRFGMVPASALALNLPCIQRRHSLTTLGVMSLSGYAPRNGVRCWSIIPAYSSAVFGLIDSLLSNNHVTAYSSNVCAAASVSIRSLLFSRVRMPASHLSASARVANVSGALRRVPAWSV